MATRLYLPNTGTISSGFVPDANPNPATYTYWDTSGTISRLPMLSAKSTDTKSTLATTITTADGSVNYVRAIWASEPVASNVTLNVSGLGTVTGQIRMSTSAASGYADMVLSRYRSGVYTDIAYGASNALSSATLTNRASNFSYSSSDIALLTGDRIVLYIALANDAGTSQTVSLRVGSDSGSDLPEDNVSTTDLNPWVEFGETITFSAASSSGTKKIMYGSRHMQRSR